MHYLVSLISPGLLIYIRLKLATAVLSFSHASGLRICSIWFLLTNLPFLITYCHLKKNSLFEFYFFIQFLHHWKNENDLFSIKFHSSELNVLFLLNIIPFMLALKRYVSCKILLTKYNCFTKIVFWIFYVCLNYFVMKYVF